MYKMIRTLLVVAILTALLSTIAFAQAPTGQAQPGYYQYTWGQAPRQYGQTYYGAYQPQQAYGYGFGQASDGYYYAQIANQRVYPGDLIGIAHCTGGGCY